MTACGWIYPDSQTLTDAVHQYDTKLGIQLWEGGIQAGGRVQFSPSGITVAVKAVGDQTLARRWSRR